MKISSQLSQISINSTQSSNFNKQFNNLKREERWNNRFHIDIMKPYNVLSDEHTGG